MVQAGRQERSATFKVIPGNAAFKVQVITPHFSLFSYVLHSTHYTHTQLPLQQCPIQTIVCQLFTSVLRFFASTVTTFGKVFMILAFERDSHQVFETTSVLLSSFYEFCVLLVSSEDMCARDGKEA